MIVVRECQFGIYGLPRSHSDDCFLKPRNIVSGTDSDVLIISGSAIKRNVILIADIIYVNQISFFRLAFLNGDFFGIGNHHGFHLFLDLFVTRTIRIIIYRKSLILSERHVFVHVHRRDIVCFFFLTGRKHKHQRQQPE